MRVSWCKGTASDDGEWVQFPYRAINYFNFPIPARLAAVLGKLSSAT